MLQRRAVSWVNQPGAASSQVSPQITAAMRSSLRIQGKAAVKPQYHLTRFECLLRPRPWLPLEVGRTCRKQSPLTETHTETCRHMPVPRGPRQCTWTQTCREKGGIVCHPSTYPKRKINIRNVKITPGAGEKARMAQSLLTLALEGGGQR